MDIREIRLQALNKGVTPVVHMVQGDTGRVLRMYPEDMSATLFQSAVLAVHRPDDSYYSITCDFDDKDYFDADMTQALTRPGRVACQLKVSYSADLVSTYTFYVMVESSTDGLPVEQLGYDIYDLIEAAETITPSPGLTDDIKQALLDCFEHVAWTDEHGQDYVDALEAALYPPAELASISAVYTQSGTVYTTDSLDDLKSDLVVTATYTDSTTETVTTYTLSGTLTEGTSVITVSYGGKTTTFNVTVTAPATLSSITAVYTQSGTVYDTDTLDSLKSDLVVTAVYSDSTTETVTNYTLSGTLTEGTSTITVSYGGKTTTFSVTVTEYVEPYISTNFTFPITATWSPNNNVATLSEAIKDKGTQYRIEIDVTSISAASAYITLSVTGSGAASFGNTQEYAGQTGKITIFHTVSYNQEVGATSFSIACNKGSESANQTAVISDIRIYEVQQ